MKVYFHPAAEEELTESVSFYEDQERGLGYEFALEVYSTIQILSTALMQANPGR